MGPTYRGLSKNERQAVFVAAFHDNPRIGPSTNIDGGTIHISTYRNLHRMGVLKTGKFEAKQGDTVKPTKFIDDIIQLALDAAM